MIDKKNLLSIGDFSKQTGVSIKSLRYYDELGILVPVYIDKFTNYRYYSFEQIAIVNVIKLCINLGIPLKQIRNFAKKKDDKINYEELIKYGIESTQNRIYELTQKVSFFNKIESELSRINSYSFNKAQIFNMPEKYCYTIPYQGILGSGNYREKLKHLFSEITNKGYKVGCESGILLNYNKNYKSQFIFIDIDYNGSTLPENVIYIPSSKYICRKNKYSCIDKVDKIFKEQFSIDYDKLIFESWKYTGEFNTSDTFFEMRCSLPRK